MVAPTITFYGNTGTNAAPSWTDIAAVAGFSAVKFTDENKANQPIPPAGTDYTSEIWIIATVDAEICAGDDLYTADATDKVFAVRMVNNDTDNPFTDVKLTIWDNNDQTGTAKPITNTGDTTVQMRAAKTGYFTGAPGGAWNDLGAWTWTVIGGNTKINLQGSGLDGSVTDGNSPAYTENVAVTSTAVPADNAHYKTLSYSWT